MAFGLALLSAPALAAAAPGTGDGAEGEDDDLAPEIVGILDVEVVGVSDTAAQMFEDSLVDGLEGSGFKVAPRERLLALLGDSTYREGCLFGPCLQEIYRITKVELVLVARITGVGSSYTFVVSLLDTKSGLPTSQVAETCAVCTYGEAMSSATLAIVELVSTPDAAVDKEAGPTSTRSLEELDLRIAALEKKARGSRKNTRRVGAFFLAAAVVAGGASAYFFTAGDESKVGWATAGGAASLGVAGVTVLLLSRRF